VNARRRSLTAADRRRISGRIVDANGDQEGMRAMMELQFAANRAACCRIVGVGRRLTNDQGRYRLYGIPPANTW